MTRIAALIQAVESHYKVPVTTIYLGPDDEDLLRECQRSGEPAEHLNYIYGRCVVRDCPQGLKAGTDQITTGIRGPSKPEFYDFEHPEHAWYYDRKA